MPIIRFENRDNDDRRNPDIRKIEASKNKKRTANNRREARESSKIAIKLDGSFTLSRRPTYCNSLYISNIGYNTLISTSAGDETPADPRNPNLPDGLKFSYVWKYGYPDVPGFPGTGEVKDFTAGDTGNFGMEPRPVSTDGQAPTWPGMPNSPRLAWYHIAKYLKRDVIGIITPATLYCEVSIIDEKTNEIYDTRLLDLGVIQQPTTDGRNVQLNVCYISKQENPGIGVPNEYHPYSSQARTVERGNLLIARSDHWPRKVNDVMFNAANASIEYKWYKKTGEGDWTPFPETVSYHRWILPYNDGEGVNQGFVVPETLFEGEDVFKAEVVLTYEVDDEPSGFKRTTRSSSDSETTSEDSEFIGNDYKGGAHSISGYYPLYEQKRYADKASPNNSSHMHTLEGKEFYMPDGVPYVHNYNESGDGIIPGQYGKISSSPTVSRSVQRQQELDDLNRQEDLQEDLIDREDPNPVVRDPAPAPAPSPAPTRRSSSSSSSSSGSGGY